jgi:hypothetical protein
MLPHARRGRTFSRRTIARAWCALVALSLLFGIAQARTRYFYCEALGLSATDPCSLASSGARQEPPCPLPSLDRARFDCCKVVTMPSMPSMAERARSVEPSVPQTGVVALLPPARVADGGAPVHSARFAWEGERWRGPPRASRERRAQLMVFLT